MSSYTRQTLAWIQRKCLPFPTPSPLSYNVTWFIHRFVMALWSPGDAMWYWTSMRTAMGELAFVNWWYNKIQSLPEHKHQFYFRLSPPSNSDPLRCTKTASLHSFTSHSSRSLFKQRTSFELRNSSCESFLGRLLLLIKRLFCQTLSISAVSCVYWNV